MAQRVISEDKAAERKLLADTFPEIGFVRPVQCAAYLNIGLSTYWKYGREGRIKIKKLSGRISGSDAKHIRQLADNGIPMGEGEL